MDEIKDLLKEMNNLNQRARKLADNKFDKEPIIYFEIEFARKHLEDGLDSLEKSLERLERKMRAG